MNKTYILQSSRIWLQNFSLNAQTQIYGGITQKKNQHERSSFFMPLGSDQLTEPENGEPWNLNIFRFVSVMNDTPKPHLLTFAVR